MLLGSSLSLTSPATTTFKVVDSNNALPVLPWLTSTHLLQQSFSTDLLVSLLSNLSSKCKSDCVTPCRKSIDSLQIQIPSRKHSEFSSRKYKGLPENFLQLYWHSLFFLLMNYLKLHLLHLPPLPASNTLPYILLALLVSSYSSSGPTVEHLLNFFS